jgi:hypothetical protein
MSTHFRRVDTGVDYRVHNTLLHCGKTTIWKPENYLSGGGIFSYDIEKKCDLYVNSIL